MTPRVALICELTRLPEYASSPKERIGLNLSVSLLEKGGPKVPELLKPWTWLWDGTDEEGDKGIRFAFGTGDPMNLTWDVAKEATPVVLEKATTQAGFKEWLDTRFTAFEQASPEHARFVRDPREPASAVAQQKGHYATFLGVLSTLAYPIPHQARLACYAEVPQGSYDYLLAIPQFHVGKEPFSPDKKESITPAGDGLYEWPYGSSLLTSFAFPLPKKPRAGRTFIGPTGGWVVRAKADARTSNTYDSDWLIDLALRASEAFDVPRLLLEGLRGLVARGAPELLAEFRRRDRIHAVRAAFLCALRDRSEMGLHAGPDRGRLIDVLTEELGGVDASELDAVARAYAQGLELSDWRTLFQRALPDLAGSPALDFVSTPDSAAIVAGNGVEGLATELQAVYGAAGTEDGLRALFLAQWDEAIARFGSADLQRRWSQARVGLLETRLPSLRLADAQARQCVAPWWPAVLEHGAGTQDESDAEVIRQNLRFVPFRYLTRRLLDRPGAEDGRWPEVPPALVDPVREVIGLLTDPIKTYLEDWAEDLEVGASATAREAHVLPTPPPIGVQVDRVHPADTGDERADALRGMAGVLVFIRQETPEWVKKKWGKVHRPWRLLNVAGAKLTSQGVANPVSFPGIVAPERIAYRDDVRASIVTYRNQPLVARGIDFSGVSDGQAQFVSKVVDLDPSPCELPKDPTATIVIGYDQCMDAERRRWAMLPFLADGQRYQLATCWVPTSGALPEVLTGDATKEGWHPAKLRAQDDAFQIDDDHTVQATWMRRVPVSAPYVDGSKPLVLPTPRPGTFPLAPELGLDGVYGGPAGDEGTAEVRGALAYFLDPTRHAGTLVLADAWRMRFESVGRVVAGALHAHGFRIGILRTEQIEVGALALDRTTRLVTLSWRGSSVSSEQKLAPFDLVSITLEATRDGSTRTLTAVIREVHGAKRRLAELQLTDIGNAKDDEELYVQVVAEGSGLVVSPPRIESAERIVAPPKADAPPQYFTWEEAPAADVARISLRRPAADIQTWEASTARDQWDDPDEWKPADPGPIGRRRAEVLADYHAAVSLRRSATRRDQREALLVALDDPAIAPFFVVELVPMFGASDPRVLQVELSDVPVAGEPMIAAAQRMGVDLSIEYGLKTTISWSKTPGDPVVATIAKGEVAVLNVYAAVPRERFQPGPQQRFPHAWLRGRSTYAVGARTYVLTSPFRIVLEAASPVVPTAAAVRAALRTEFDGRATRIDFAPAADPAFYFVRGLALMRQAWRWDGRATPPFPFQPPAGLDHLPLVFEPGALHEVQHPYQWDVHGFGERSDEEHVLAEAVANLPPHATPLERRDLYGDTRAHYLRYALRITSRYAPYLPAKDATVEGRRQVAGLARDWTRMLVPCRRLDELPVPLVRVAVPALRDIRRQAGSEVRESVGSWIVLDEAAYEACGLAERFEAEVVPFLYEHAAECRDPEPVLQFGPDPILTAEPGRDPDLFAEQPVGYTFDTTDAAALFTRAAVLLRQTGPNEQFARWPFAQIRLRRVAAAEALPDLARRLQEQPKPIPLSKPVVHELGSGTARRTEHDVLAAELRLSHAPQGKITHGLKMAGRFRAEVELAVRPTGAGDEVAAQVSYRFAASDGGPWQPTTVAQEVWRGAKAALAIGLSFRVVQESSDVPGDPDGRKRWDATVRPYVRVGGAWQPITPHASRAWTADAHVPRVSQELLADASEGWTVRGDHAAPVLASPWTEASWIQFVPSSDTVLAELSPRALEEWPRSLERDGPDPDFVLRLYPEAPPKSALPERPRGTIEHWVIVTRRVFDAGGECREAAGHESFVAVFVLEDRSAGLCRRHPLGPPLDEKVLDGAELRGRVVEIQRRVDVVAAGVRVAYLDRENEPRWRVLPDSTGEGKGEYVILEVAEHPVGVDYVLQPRSPESAQAAPAFTIQRRVDGVVWVDDEPLGDAARYTVTLRRNRSAGQLIATLHAGGAQKSFSRAMQLAADSLWLELEVRARSEHSLRVHPPRLGTSGGHHEPWGLVLPTLDQDTRRSDTDRLPPDAIARVTHLTRPFDLKRT